MEPETQTEQTRARESGKWGRKTIQVLLAIALIVGFTPIPNDIAYADDVPQPEALVDGAGEETPENSDEVPSVIDDEEAVESSDDEPQAGGDLEQPDDPVVEEDVVSSPEAAEEASTSDAGEAVAEEPAEGEEIQPLAEEDPAVEEDLPVEGPENSFRYEDGVPIGQSQLMRSGGLTSTPTWNSSYGTNKYVYYNASGNPITHTVSGATAVGVDVSEHQGLIDWAKVKASGVTFAIIRVGYGSDYESQDDKYFAQNIEGALNNGIAIGVYIYSYATKVSGGTGSAEGEAQHVLRVLRSKGVSPSVLTLPVYYDMEDKVQSGLSASALGDIAERFCNTISAAGYKVGVYASQSWWKNKLTSPKFDNPNWSRWVAQYCNYDKPQVDFEYGFWQFTSHGQVEGINGYADVNFSTGNIYGPKNTWRKSNGYWYYYGADGVPVKYSQKIDGKFYYFNEKGQMQTGWVQWQNDKTWSLFQSDGSAKTGWLKEGGYWYYLDPATGRSALWEKTIDGKHYYFDAYCHMVTGWLKYQNGSWSYYNSDGAAAIGWKKLSGKWYYLDPQTTRAAIWEKTIDGKRYYFNGSNQMQTGWLKYQNGSWSYYNSNGAAAIGWKKLGGTWYYLDPQTTRAAKGEAVVDGKHYYFNGSNAMLTGWVKHSDGWSYYNGSGAAATGWKKLSGKWYYLDPKTTRAALWEKTIDGGHYYFNGSNQMQTGWLKYQDGSWSYYNSNGAAAIGWKKLSGKWYYLDPQTTRAAKWEKVIDGKRYYFDGSNAMVTGWIKFSDGWSYYSSSGAALTGWQTIGGKRYYFDPSTGRALQGTHTIDGEVYFFDSSAAFVGKGGTHATENTGVMLASFTQAQQKINSGSGISAAMNPASFPVGSNGYYQFARLDQGYSGVVTAEQIDAFIESTDSGRKGTLRGTGQYFVDAAKLYGINEVYLLAHAIHETGWGTSTFAKGYSCNGKLYYSFYGIAAFDKNPNNTQNYAVKQGWDSIRNGIVGGGQWIASNYIHNITRNQNTLYKMRWNYPQYAKGQGVGNQYATDPQWAVKIAGIMASAYKYMGQSQQSCGLTYLVPQYA